MEGNINEYVKEIYFNSIFPSTNSRHKILLLFNYLKKGEDRNTQEKCNIIENLALIMKKNIDSILPLFEVGDNLSFEIFHILFDLYKNNPDNNLRNYLRDFISFLSDNFQINKIYFDEIYRRISNNYLNDNFDYNLFKSDLEILTSLYKGEKKDDNILKSYFTFCDENNNNSLTTNIKEIRLNQSISIKFWFFVSHYNYNQKCTLLAFNMGYNFPIKVILSENNKISLLYENKIIIEYIEIDFEKWNYFNLSILNEFKKGIPYKQTFIFKIGNNEIKTFENDENISDKLLISSLNFFENFQGRFGTIIISYGKDKEDIVNELKEIKLISNKKFLNNNSNSLICVFSPYFFDPKKYEIQDPVNNYVANIQKSNGELNLNTVKIFSDYKKNIFLIGGINNILPLFDIINKNKSCFQNLEKQEVLILIMKIVEAILVNHPKNWIDAAENNFFNLLSFFLEYLIGEFYSDQFIEIINNIANYSLELIKDYDIQIYKDFYNNILFNFKIIIQFPEETQKTIFSILNLYKEVYSNCLDNNCIRNFINYYILKNDKYGDNENLVNIMSSIISSKQINDNERGNFLHLLVNESISENSKIYIIDCLYKYFHFENIDKNLYEEKCNSLRYFICEYLLNILLYCLIKNNIIIKSKIIEFFQFLHFNYYNLLEKYLVIDDFIINRKQNELSKNEILRIIRVNLPSKFKPDSINNPEENDFNEDLETFKILFCENYNLIFKVSFQDWYKEMKDDKLNENLVTDQNLEQNIQNLCFTTEILMKNFDAILNNKKDLDFIQLNFHYEFIDAVLKIMFNCLKILNYDDSITTIENIYSYAKKAFIKMYKINMSSTISDLFLFIIKINNFQDLNNEEKRKMQLSLLTDIFELITTSRNNSIKIAENQNIKEFDKDENNVYTINTFYKYSLEIDQILEQFYITSDIDFQNYMNSDEPIILQLEDIDKIILELIKKKKAKAILDETNYYSEFLDKEENSMLKFLKLARLIYPYYFYFLIEKKENVPEKYFKKYESFVLVLLIITSLKETKDNDPKFCSMEVFRFSNDLIDMNLKFLLTLFYLEKENENHLTIVINIILNIFRFISRFLIGKKIDEFSLNPTIINLFVNYCINYENEIPNFIFNIEFLQKVSSIDNDKFKELIIISFDKEDRKKLILRSIFNKEMTNRNELLNEKKLDLENLEYNQLEEELKKFPKNIEIKTFKNNEYVQKIKLKKQYRKFKKHVFSWNNSYSNLDIFYTEEGKELLKYKISNHLSKEMIRPLIIPVLDLNYYFPILDNYNFKFMFNESKDKSYNINLNEFPLKEEKNDIEYDFECCLIKSTNHIKGVIKKNENNFEFIGYDYQIDENALYYDKVRERCYGSVYSKENEKDKEYYLNVKISDIDLLFKREYFFVNHSIEIFCKNNKSYYFHFKDESKRESFINKVFSRTLFSDITDKDLNKIGYYRNDLLYSCIDVIQSNWLTRKISSLAYLMFLNIYGNRSFRDPTQYPVFPWVLTNYENTEQLNGIDDINRIKEILHENYLRDLSVPMGMMTLDEKGKNRRNSYIETFRVMVDNLNLPIKKINNDESDIPQYDLDINKMYLNKNIEHDIIPYFFGSHYSNSTYISNFLIRLYPYSLINIGIQGNGFDIADRLFIKLKHTFNGSSREKADLRELTPEFFSLPEVFLNLNQFNFGTLRNYLPEDKDNIKINNVMLPEWTNNSVYNLIVIQREILEDDRTQIEKWIDLIFGVYQRGILAQKIGNIYPAYCYNGVISSRINNNNYEKLLGFQEFGVVPHIQLKIQSVPRIQIKNEMIKFENNFWIKSNFDLSDFYSDYHNNGIVHSWECYNLKKEKINKNKDKRFLLNKNNFCVINKLNSIVLGGYFDGSIIVSKVKNNFTEEEIDTDYEIRKSNFKISNRDNSIVTIMAIDKEEEFIIVGTKKGSLIIYIITEEKVIFYKMIHSHIKKINNIYINSTLNMFIDYSDDNYINLYTLPKAEITHSIYEKNITFVLLSNSPLPCFITYSNEDKLFKCYNVNGKELIKLEIDEGVHNPFIYTSKNFVDYLVYKSDYEKLIIRKFPYLNED